MPTAPDACLRDRPTILCLLSGSVYYAGCFGGLKTVRIVSGDRGGGGPAPGGLFIRGDVSLILRLALISPEESFGEMTALWIFQKSPGCLARKVGRVVAYLP